MKISYRLITAMILALSVSAPSMAADSTNYPTRPVTIVVPFTPASGIDLIARTIAPKLNDKLGQPVVVTNKPGASGNIGADTLAKADPDGHTLMVTVSAFTITPAFYKSVPYDPIKDFEPIGQLAVGNLALVINPSVLPVDNFQDFVKYVSARPGKLNYGSPGSGTPQHLAVEILKDHLKLDIVHVPYKGAAGASTDLLGGQIQMMVLPIHTALPLAATGKLRVLAVSGKERSILAPESPSFAEVGLQSLDIDMYYWLAAPAGTRKEIISKLNGHIGEIIAMPEVRETLLKQGMIPTTSTPEAIAGMIDRDVTRWKQFVAEKGLTAN